MSAPHQRRGLGRGLGALIPTGPRVQEVAPESDEPAADLPTTSADWIGTPLPGDASLTVPDSPAALLSESEAAEPRHATETMAGHGGDEHAPGDQGSDDRHAGTLPAPSPSPAADAIIEDAESGTVAPASEGAVPPTASDDAVAEERVGGPAPGDNHGVVGGAGLHARGSAVDAGAWFAELPVDEIRPNPRQPREVFDEEAMAELVLSITEVGLLQPVVVRPVEDGYELVMGERRWRATREAGLQTIPAIVRETGDDDLLRDALLENLHRAQLNALEEAAAYQQLLEDFGCTHEELATRIGRSRPQISNTLRLLKLPPAVQRRVAAGVLSPGHARALLAVPDAAQQDRLAGRVVAEGISVRSLEELVAVGDGTRAAPAPRRARPTAPGVDHLASRLSDRLDTSVRVELGRRKGRLTVDFATLADLERIVALIEEQEQSLSST